MKLSLDKELQLLAGLPLFIDDVIPIFPLTLKQIAQVGYSKYDEYLKYLTAQPKDFGFDVDNMEDVNMFDILMSNLLYADDKIKEMLFTGLQLFLGDITLLLDVGVIQVNNVNQVIHRENYQDFCQCLKWNNCIQEHSHKEEFKPINKKAEEIQQKIMKSKQFLSVKNEITLFDLISVLAANGYGLDILNIWDLTMFQFNDQFIRMQMIEEYDINIKSLLAGAKSEDVRLKHYIRKTNSYNEQSTKETSNERKQYAVNKVKSFDN